LLNLDLELSSDLLQMFLVHALYLNSTVNQLGSPLKKQRPKPAIPILQYSSTPSYATRICLDPS
jgi:hypothetical protein